MPRLLALDSSTEACSAALIDGDILCQRYVEAPREHMARLLPMVDELLVERGCALRDLDAIAFARGPGSFTGLRICMGIVQGLAFGANLPVIPVSTLAALAQTWIAAQPQASICSPGTRILSAIDARMDEVYWGWFGVDAAGLVESLGGESLSAPENVEVDGANVRIGVGSGWRYRPRISDAGFAVVDQTVLPSAAAVAQLASSIWLRGGAVHVEQATPVYLRDKVV